MKNVYFKLNAGNDVNGNPRRVYVVQPGKGKTLYFDEGYQGIKAIPEKYRKDSIDVGTFATTEQEYFVLLHEIKQQGKVK
jgi:hypothetical protein